MSSRDRLIGSDTFPYEKVAGERWAGLQFWKIKNHNYTRALLFVVEWDFYFHTE